MTDRPDQPMSSDEMLAQFRDQVAADTVSRMRGSTEPPASPPPDRSTRPARPAADRAPRNAAAPDEAATRAGRRPPVPIAPPTDPAARRRAVIVAAISLGLVVFGAVVALLFAQPT